MSNKLDLEELPYEPECSVQRLDNWAAVDRRETLSLPTWIVEDVIIDCEGDFVALVELAGSSMCGTQSSGSSPKKAAIERVRCT